MNEKINVADATQIQLYIAELEVIAEFNFNAADVTKDSKLNVMDVTNIQLHIAEYPCVDGIGKPVFE